MTPDEHETPESTGVTSLDPGDTPGYAEEQPDSTREARKSGPSPKPDPEDGGMERDPEADRDPASG